MHSKVYRVEDAEFQKACKRDGRIKVLLRRIQTHYALIKTINNEIMREKSRVRRFLKARNSYRRVRDMKSLARIAANRAVQEQKRHNKWLDKMAREKFLAELEKQKQYGYTTTGQKHGDLQGPGKNGGGENENHLDQGNNKTGGSADSEAKPLG